MTREEHLQFCRKCTNRKLDMKQGLLCNLTGEKADFEGECESFNLDNTVVEKVTEGEADAQEVPTINLSDEQMEKLRSQQNYPLALIAGLVVGIIGAILWGAITVATEYQIGYMALAIGAGVGFSMKFTGKGIDQIFGITGGLIAILSCLLGNYFSIIGFIANDQALGYMETMGLIDFGLILDFMGESFSPIDILFYGIAAYEGYKFSFRTLTEQDLHALR